MAGSLEQPRTFATRSGDAIEVRRIRPEDRGELLASFERLSPDSRYRRFLAPTPRLPGQTVRYLTDVDHHDHEAIVALEPGSGRGVGVARYVRVGAEVAEAAVTVADDWHGRGAGSLLLDLLALRAREEGVARFRALMLTSNDDMRDMLERLGPVQTLARDTGTVEVEVVLPQDGAGEQLRDLLRFCAEQDALAAAHPAPGSSG